MAINLARLSAPTLGEASRLNTMKAPKAPKLTPYKAPKAPTTSSGVAANDQFNLADPYKPGTLQTTATNAYNADVANANKLANMGTTPDSQIASDYAQRAQNVNSVYQALQQQLAGIQTATVAQGNAGSASLAAQNAGIGAPAGILPTAGAQAVLGANTAATGNYGGSLQAAALSAGAQGSRAALDAGTLAQTTNDQNIQKTLASLLSGVDPVSKRVDAMRTANQGVDATNVQTGLSLYTADEAAKAAAITAGNKDAYDEAVLNEKRDYDNSSNRTKLLINQRNNTTKVTTNASDNATKTATTATTQAGATARAKATAAAKVKAAATTAAAKKAAAGTTGKTIKTYRVTIDVPQADKPGKADKLTGLPGTPIKQPNKRVSKPIPAAVWKKFLASGPPGKRNFAIIGLPKGSNVTAATGY